MAIRAARMADAEQIQSIVISLKHYYLNEPTSELPQWFTYTLQVDEFKRRLTSEDFTNFVYLLNGKVVGYISVKARSHLYHLFVSEHHQGKGVSTQLWAHANKQLGGNIKTVRSSLYAVPVYNKFGFTASDSVQIKDGIAFQPMTIV